jgi:ribosome-associated heat shock protein Hsp15
LSVDKPVATQSQRLDQWLWFARFVKSRSLAARLIAAGVVTLNGSAVRKANQAVRIGDKIAVPQGGFCRTVHVMALGIRRGPAAEARLLYHEPAGPVRLVPPEPEWVPLLADGPGEEEGEGGRSGALPGSG